VRQQRASHGSVRSLEGTSIREVAADCTDCVILPIGWRGEGSWPVLINWLVHGQDGQGRGPKCKLNSSCERSFIKWRWELHEPNDPNPTSSVRSFHSCMEAIAFIAVYIVYTIRNLEIYDISRVTFNIGVTELTYLWWYMKFRHRILMDPGGYQNIWHFYDDSSIYRHKLKQEIVNRSTLGPWQIINHHNLKREIVTDCFHLAWHFGFIIVWKLKTVTLPGKKSQKTWGGKGNESNLTPHGPNQVTYHYDGWASAINYGFLYISSGQVLFSTN
jgi:hypothetical protein